MCKLNLKGNLYEECSGFTRIGVGPMAGEQGNRYSDCEEHEKYLDELDEYYFLKENLSTTLDTYVLTAC